MYLWGMSSLKMGSPSLNKELCVETDPVILEIEAEDSTQLMRMLTTPMIVTHTAGIACKWYSGFVKTVLNMKFKTLSEACKIVLRVGRQPTINVYMNLSIDPAGEYPIGPLRQSRGFVQWTDICLSPPTISPRIEVLKRKRHEVEALIGESLTNEQVKSLEKKLQIENIQEIACSTYLRGRANRQHRLHGNDGTYVIADVFDTRTSQSSPHGCPWEVKDCDSLNLVEHAHGQADFQRIYAKSENSCLWLFTQDAPSSNGRRNFEILCRDVIPKTENRYDTVILARRIGHPTYDETASTDANDGRVVDASILATWCKNTRKIVWRAEFSMFEDELDGDASDDESLTQRCLRKKIAS